MIIKFSLLEKHKQRKQANNAIKNSWNSLNELKHKCIENDKLTKDVYHYTKSYESLMSILECWPPFVKIWTLGYLTNIYQDEKSFFS